MRTIAVVNQKGGVGKTTTTVNLGHALARAGKRVMIVDLDPQGHVGSCLGLFRTSGEGVDGVLLDGAEPMSRALSVRDDIWLLPPGNRLVDVEKLQGGTSRAALLLNALDNLGDDIDIVLFDCPPSAGLLIVNAVVAADDVVIPVAGDYLSLTGLARFMQTIERLQPLRKAPLRQWVFMSRFVARRRLAREVLDKVLEHFAEHLLVTSVSEAAALAECAGAGQTIFEYRENSRSAREFDELAVDVLEGRIFGNEQKETSHVA